MNRAAVIVLLVTGCSAPMLAGDAGAPDAGSTDAGPGTCPLEANTSLTGTVTGTCAQRTRDTGACRAQRTDAGLSGFWLDFSCRVTLSVAGSSVRAVADSQPDYPSNFFATTHACHDDYVPQSPNPNHIAAQNLVIDFPRAPAAGQQAMAMGTVGLALNGVSLFNNQAAPGDDIFLEVRTFDRCQAHPAPGDRYHYHTEPPSISYDDPAFIGVVRDGFALYGRRDPDGGLPTLDATGGHVGPTVHGATPVFHYHVNEQTSTGATTAGQKQWFLTTGQYQGPPGICTGC